MHAPQPVHAISLMFAFSFSMLIASAGQISIQSPQPVQVSRFIKALVGSISPLVFKKFTAFIAAPSDSETVV